jgi:hypothetical protein
VSEVKQGGKYAINLADLSRPEFALPVAMLVRPVAMKRELVQIERNQPDSTAIVLECNDEQAYAVIDTIRIGARRRGLQVRAYERGPRGGWMKV